MWWHDGFNWGWMMLSSGLMMILFWGGLIALAIVIVRAISGSGLQRSANSASSSPSIHNTALNILKERYARGEISKAEYEEMRDNLAN